MFEADRHLNRAPQDNSTLRNEENGNQIYEYYLFACITLITSEIHGVVHEHQVHLVYISALGI